MQESTTIVSGEVTKATRWELRVNADDHVRNDCDLVYRQVKNDSDTVTFRQSVPLNREDFMAVGRHMGWLPQAQVVCTDSAHADLYLTVGRTYIVNYETKEGYVVIDDQGITSEWKKDRFDCIK